MSRQYLTAVGLTSIVRSQGHIHKVYEKKNQVFHKKFYVCTIHEVYMVYITHTKTKTK